MCPTPLSPALTALPGTAGMTRKDFQIGVHVLNQGQTLKAVYAHNISPSTAAAAELTRSLKQQDEPTAITLG